jgi:hypothetical protein
MWNRSAFMTQRFVYFFVLWLPMLVASPSRALLILYVLPTHLPYAIAHTLRARRKPTARLLADSWRIPLSFAAWVAFEGACVFGYDQLTSRLPRSLWRLFTDSGAWGTLIFYAGCGLAVAALFVIFGWLVLLTLAARWPLDRDNRAWR